MAQKRQPPTGGHRKACQQRGRQMKGRNPRRSKGHPWRTAAGCAGGAWDSIGGSDWLIRDRSASPWYAGWRFLKDSFDVNLNACTALNAMAVRHRRWLKALPIVFVLAGCRLRWQRGFGYRPGLGRCWRPGHSSVLALCACFAPAPQRATACPAQSDTGRGGRSHRRGMVAPQRHRHGLHQFPAWPLGLLAAAAICSTSAAFCCVA